MEHLNMPLIQQFLDMLIISVKFYENLPVIYK